MKTTSISKQPIRWSQDGRAGGHRASTSSHVGHPSGHPPGTGGGLLTPKERGRSPTGPGRTLRERKSGGGTWPASLRGCWERGGVSTIGGAHPWYGELWGQEKTFGGWGDQRGREPAFSRLFRSRQPAGVGGWISTLWVLSLSAPPRPFLATQVWSLSPALPRAFTGRVDPGPKPPAPRPPLATRIPGLNLPPLHYQGLFLFLFFFLLVYCFASLFLRFCFFMVYFSTFLHLFSFLLLFGALFFGMLFSLPGLGSQAGGWTGAPAVGALNPNPWTKGEPKSSGESNWYSSPRGFHLGTKTQLHPTACKLQWWMPHAKQSAKWEHKSMHQEKCEDGTNIVQAKEHSKNYKSKKM